MGWSFVKMGLDLRSVGEVSSILHLKFYPLAYAMGGAFFGECVVLINDMRHFSVPDEVDHE
jgi:hypothetical protein